MSKTLGCAAVMLLTPLLAMAGGQTLEVGAGEEQVIEAAELRLERLRLEDGATLRLAPGIEHLHLVAQQAWIGRGVRVLAAGSEAAALPAQLPAGTPRPCEQGIDGAAGQAGTAGAPGRHLSIELGLVQFGSLLLDTRGGDGAAGQEGQAGAAGGEAADCTGGNGGQGGRGGDGGAGGRGGDVALRYWSLGEGGHIPVSNFGPGVQILTAGGSGAQGGRPGAGGAGGAGEFSKRGNGIKVYRNAGAAGQPGAPGVAGADGLAGQFIVQPQARPESGR